MMDRDALADRLEQEGRFEIIRGIDSSGPRSAQIWLTECERDNIVEALRNHITTKRTTRPPIIDMGLSENEIAAMCGGKKAKRRL